MMVNVLVHEKEEQTKTWIKRCHWFLSHFLLSAYYVYHSSGENIICWVDVFLIEVVSHDIFFGRVLSL